MTLPLTLYVPCSQPQVLSLILANQEGEATPRGFTSWILSKAVISWIHSAFCLEHGPTWGEANFSLPFSLLTVLPCVSAEC